MNSTERQSVRSNEEEPFDTEAHDIFLRLKNKEDKREIEATNQPPTIFSCLYELINIVGDWVIDLIIAGFHFYQGRYVVGSLTLFFVFVGGLFVNFCLLKLTRRKGAKKFREELKKIHPVLLYLIYVPSILPFFSGGMRLYYAYKLRKLDATIDKVEVKRLEKLLNICDDLYATDTLYENSFEAHPQAVLQLINLIEKPVYKSLVDFLPLVGVFVVWIGITMTPIKLAKSLNNLQIKWTQIVAGLGNKAVTLLSYTFIIAGSRNYFADPETVDGSLVAATLFSILGLSLFSELPGLVAFQLELRLNKKQKHVRMKMDWEILINLISLLIPLTAIIYWMLAMFYTDQLDKVRVIVLCSIFILSFVVNILGFWAFKYYLHWLGQFSMDILLLLTISFYSYFKRMEFQQIDFNYEPQHLLNVANIPSPSSDTTNNNMMLLEKNVDTRNTETV